MSSEGANLFNEGYRGWPHPTVKVEPTPSRRARSPHASMPLACQSQQSRPVSSGQPRTTALPPRPALVLVLAGADPGRAGFGSRGSHLLAVLDRGTGLTVSREPPLDHGLAVSRLPTDL